MALYLHDPTVDAHSDASTRCLCRIEDGEVFAYATRANEYARRSDRRTWAVEHDGLLVSARSGEVLAVRRGKVFFASESGQPLYYERAR